MSPQSPDKIIEFEGAQHHFPADFSDQDISKALASLHPQGGNGEYKSGLRKIPIIGNALGAVDENIVEPSMERVSEGVEQLLGRPAQNPERSKYRTDLGGESRTSQVLGGASNIGRGAAQAVGGPLLLNSAASAPIKTALALGAGAGAQKLVQSGASALGADPGTSQAAGDTAALLTGRQILKPSSPSPPPSGPSGGAPPAIPPVAKFLARRLPMGKFATDAYELWRQSHPEASTADKFGRFTEQPLAAKAPPQEQVDKFGRFTPPQGLLPKPIEVAPGPDKFGTFTPPKGLLPKEPPPEAPVDRFGKFTPPIGLAPKIEAPQAPDKFGTFTPQPIASKAQAMGRAIRDAQAQAPTTSQPPPASPGSPTLEPGKVPVRQHATVQAVDSAVTNKVQNIGEFARNQGLSKADLDLMSPEQRMILASEAHKAGRAAGRSVPKNGYKSFSEDTFKLVREMLEDQ